MKLRTILATLILALAPFAAAQTLTTYNSPAGDFSISLPAQPTVTTDTIKDATGADVKETVYHVAEANGNFIDIFTDVFATPLTDDKVRQVGQEFTTLVGGDIQNIEEYKGGYVVFIQLPKTDDHKEGRIVYYIVSKGSELFQVAMFVPTENISDATGTEAATVFTSFKD